MFIASSIAALVTLAAPAQAASDLTSTITVPTGVYVEAAGSYSVKVSNTGNKSASNVSVVIQLPVTNTSPTVHVLGTVSGLSSGCVASGTKITCSMGSIGRASSKTVSFNMAVPEAIVPVTFTAAPTTTSSENSTTNNNSSATVSLVNYVPGFSAPDYVTNRHCTGTSLTSFYECELYPSSISSHSVTYNADNTITFDAPYDVDYSGTWQIVGDELSFEYYELGNLVASFVGYGTSANCWEGATEFFPASSYMSMYEVCF